LVSDDLSMSALSGALGARAKAAFFAGCDIALHCNGNLDEMKEVAGETKPLAGPALARAKAALAQLHAPIDLDVAAAEKRLTALIGVMA
jgi:beta-N-acetylhexosaminidase